MLFFREQVWRTGGTPVPPDISPQYENEPYAIGQIRKMALKKILNLHEEATHKRLKETCEKYGALVHSKIRLADVLPIENSGINAELYRYALQAHFDFGITDEKHTPLFSVEFDGPSHENKKQVERDEKKNKLCEKFDFPILRINSNYLTKKYRNLDLLSWFIEVWFYREAFFEAQYQGLVPRDEPFNPMLVTALPGRKEHFPLWLSAELRIRIQDLAKKGRIKDSYPNEWIGADASGNYHGISWISIDNEKGVFSKSGIRIQNFPIGRIEILSELLVFQLYDELSWVLSNEVGAVKISNINKRIKEYSERYQKLFACGPHLS